MAFLDTFFLKIRRAETPFYARLKRVARSVLHANVRTPRAVIAFYEVISSLRILLLMSWRRVAIVLYREPMFRSRCQAVGARLSLERIPYIIGNPRLIVGDDVRLSGLISFGARRTFGAPEVILGNRVFVGHRVVFAVAKQIIVEDDVLIAQGCYITDNTSHPLDAELRAQGFPPGPEEVSPVKICKKAWLGRECMVLRGITIGEGAIIGARAVVTKDVPPFHLCVGNPGRIIERKSASADHS